MEFETIRQITGAGNPPDLQTSGSTQPNSSLASDVASAHGKRGRKPLPRDAAGNIVRPAKSKTDTGAGQASPVDQPQVVSTIDPVLVQESVKALLGTVDETVKKSVKITAMRLLNAENQAAILESKVAMTTTEVDMISKLSGNVAVQYQLAGQHANAAFLAVFVIGYSVRVGMVMNELKKLEALYLARKKVDGSDAKHSA